MHPHIHAKRLPSPLRKRLADMLQRAPWCWPEDSDLANMQRASKRAQMERAPTLAPGSVLLVSMHPQSATATLWALVPQRGSLPSARRGARVRPALTRACLSSWHQAAQALPRSVPVVWTSIHAAATQQPELEHVETVTQDGRLGRAPVSVDGPSFGLAFVLSLASSTLNTPLPEDVVASARVNPNGSLGAIEGLEVKMNAVARLAPRVARFFVASAQADEARAIVEANALRLEVVAAASAGEALELAYGHDLARLLIAQIHDDPQRRDAILDELFHLALGERVSVLDWTPVYEAASLLAGRLDGELTDAQRYRLHFAHAVASRHEGQPLRLGVPAPRVLEDLPRPLRVDLLAHLAQNSADGAYPRRAALEPLVADYTPHPHEASDRELKLLGALARLDANTGNPARALATQRALTLAWFARHEHDQATYPMTEWLRLAGALQDRASFEEATEALDRYTFYAPLDAPGHVYLSLAHHRGALLLTTQALLKIDALEALAKAPSHHNSLRRAFTRCLLVALQRQGATAQHQAALASLIAGLGVSPADRHLLALLALDALADDLVQGEATDHLWEACGMQPGAENPAHHALSLIPADAQPFGQLLDSFSTRDAVAQRVAQTRAEYIRRFYPY